MALVPLLRAWWDMQGSNLRPAGYEPAALPTKLMSRLNWCTGIQNLYRRLDALNKSYRHYTTVPAVGQIVDEQHIPIHKSIESLISSY